MAGLCKERGSSGLAAANGAQAQNPAYPCTPQVYYPPRTPTGQVIHGLQMRDPAFLAELKQWLENGDMSKPATIGSRDVGANGILRVTLDKDAGEGTHYTVGGNANFGTRAIM